MTETALLPQLQTFIDMINAPIILITQQGALQATNQAFQRDNFLAQRTTSLLGKVHGLLNSNSERFHWLVDEHSFVLTAIPLQQSFYMVKIAATQSSDLAKRYQNLLAGIDQMTDGLIICDTNGCIDLFNSRLERFFSEIDLSEHQGGQLSSLMTAIVEALAPYNAIDSRKSKLRLKRKLAKNEAISFSFYNSEGRYLEYRDRVTWTGERIGLIIDETDMKRLSEQYESAYMQAQQLSEAKSHFMAAMSHEIRTPLNAIIGMLDLCIDDHHALDGAMLHKMQHNAQNLLRLLNDVLDFSKLNAQKIELNIVDTNLRDLCEQCLEEFDGHAENANAITQLYVDPTLPQTVKADDLRLKQILTNLLSNAFKFTNRVQPQIILKAEALQNGKARFSVADNGIGISESRLQDIFAEFTQASPEVHRTYGGSGLGLSICQKICALMGSKLEVVSQLNEGSLFYFDVALDAIDAAEVSTLDCIKSIDIISNDDAFLAAVSHYAEALNLNCKYQKALPSQLLAHQYYFYFDPNKILPATQEPSAHSNIVLLYHFRRYQNHPPLAQLQRYPLKLRQLMTILGRIDSKREVLYERSLPSDYRHVRALLVEDNHDNMYVLKRQFAKLGIQAQFALGADDAEVYFEQQPFNLVITDFQMPHKNGAQLVSALRHLESSRQLAPAFMYVLTADKSDECEQACIKAGANQVIIKPLTLALLQQLLATTPLNQVPDTSVVEPTRGAENEETLTDLSQDSALFIDEGYSPPSEYDPSKPSVDLTVLREFIGDVPKHDRDEFLSQYLLNLLDSQQLMQSYVNSKNWSALRKKAHSLKSSSIIVGAQVLSQQCAALEQALENTPLSAQTNDLWTLLDETIIKVAADIEMVLAYG